MGTSLPAAGSIGSVWATAISLSGTFSRSTTAIATDVSSSGTSGSGNASNQNSNTIVSMNVAGRSGLSVLMFVLGLSFFLI